MICMVENTLKFGRVAKSRVAKSRVANSRVAKSRVAKSRTKVAKSRVAKSRVTKSRVAKSPDTFGGPHDALLKFLRYHSHFCRYQENVCAVCISLALSMI